MSEKRLPPSREMWPRPSIVVNIYNVTNVKINLFDYERSGVSVWNHLFQLNVDSFVCQLKNLRKLFFPLPTSSLSPFPEQHWAAVAVTIKEEGEMGDEDRDRDDGALGKLQMSVVGTAKLMKHGCL